MVFFFGTKSLSFSTYYTISFTFIILNYPHFSYSIAVCGLWLPSWTIQPEICSQLSPSLYSNFCLNITSSGKACLIASYKAPHSLYLPLMSYATYFYSFKKYLFVYLAALGLSCGIQDFFSCGLQNLNCNTGDRSLTRG